MDIHGTAVLRRLLLAGIAMVLGIVAATAAAGFTGVAGTARPAAAATADVWGFAYSDQLAPPPGAIMDPTRQWGSWKSLHPADFATVIRIAPGRYRVRMPWLASGSRGIVHVTAVSDIPRWCTAAGWFSAGVDKFIDVQCFAPGIPADTRFTVLFTMSSGVLPAGQGAHAYVQYTGAAVAQSYNSAGGLNTVVALGAPGTYRVWLPGVGLAGMFSGNLQVTAVQPNLGPQRCKVTTWQPVGTGIDAIVQCYDPANALSNSGFNVSFHRQRAVNGELAPPFRFGYLWLPGPGQTNFNSTGVPNTVVLGPVGNHQVTYPAVGVAETHLQVTASGQGPNYCAIRQPWAPLASALIADVICFTGAGAPAFNPFFASATSRI